MLAAAIKYAKSWDSQGCLELIEFGTKTSKDQNLLPDGWTQNVLFLKENSHKMLQKIPGITEGCRTGQSLLWIKKSWEQQDWKGRCRRWGSSSLCHMGCKNKSINKKLSLGDLIGRAFICRLQIGNNEALQQIGKVTEIERRAKLLQAEHCYFCQVFTKIQVEKLFWKSI